MMANMLAGERVGRKGVNLGVVRALHWVVSLVGLLGGRPAGGRVVVSVEWRVVAMAEMMGC